MIEFIKISSMAIFDEIAIEFTPGLNCITGETGAGKSLILDALTLLMGARAGRDLIRPGSEKTTIEALFAASGAEMVLRRELYPSGVNRCYINDKLTTAAGLAEAGSGLVHIYGQHEYQDLLSPRQHMRILEDFAHLNRDRVDAAYEAYIKSHQVLTDLESRIQSLFKEREYLEHCLNEIAAAGIEEGLEERLMRELKTAQKASELKQAALAAQDLIYNASPSITDLASEAREHIMRIASHDPAMERLVRSMDDIITLVEDIHVELRGRINAYEYDPRHIESLEDRVNTLRDLKRKHRTDEPGLLSLADEMRQKLALLDESGGSTSAARAALDEAFAAYRLEVKDFLEKRMHTAADLIRRINHDLAGLGMPGTDFRVRQLGPQELEDAFRITEGGTTPPNILLKGEFLISTNIGQDIKPLARIASGGELSRIMLAIKAQQKKSSEATLIFDEIDSGISGQTAIAIAKRLKYLSMHAQTIVVTHLHHLASVADSHLVITKSVKGKSTTSRLQRVKGMDRVMELARMMGGDTPSGAVIEHAKELVRSHELRSPMEH